MRRTEPSEYALSLGRAFRFLQRSSEFVAGLKVSGVNGPGVFQICQCFRILLLSRQNRANPYQRCKINRLMNQRLAKRLHSFVGTSQLPKQGSQIVVAHRRLRPQSDDFSETSLCFRIAIQFSGHQAAQVVQ